MLKKASREAFFVTLFQLAVGNEEGWSLDETQTVGGRHAAIEPLGMDWIYGVSALDQTSAQH